MTFSLGFASFNPVAKGIARPWVVWKESSFTYPATRPVQPIPETRAREFRSIFDSINARANEFTVVPMPHPGHQMCGMRSVRRKGSTGLTTLSSLIGWPPGSRSRFRWDRVLLRLHAVRTRFLLCLQRRVQLLGPFARD